MALLVLAILAAAAYGVSWASYLPQYSISSISAVGGQKVSARLVEDYAATVLYDGAYHFLSRQNVLLYPRAAIAQAVVKFFPRIKSANVSRSSLLATAVTITVEEREPYALWCPPRLASSSGEAGPDLGHCFQMDDSGFIFSQATMSLGLPAQAGATTPYVFSGALATSTNPIGQTFVPAHLPGLVALLQLLGQSGFNPLGAAVNSDQDFSVPLQGGFTVKASFGEDAGALTRNLQLILSSDPLSGKVGNLEYVDLRFGNRVYYKLKGQVEASSTTQ